MGDIFDQVGAQMQAAPAAPSTPAPAAGDIFDHVAAQMEEPKQKPDIFDEQASKMINEGQAISAEDIDRIGRERPEEMTKALLLDKFGDKAVERFRGRGLTGQPLLRDDPRGPLQESELEDYRKFQRMQFGLARRFAPDSAMAQASNWAEQMGHAAGQAIAEGAQQGMREEFSKGYESERMGDLANFGLGGMPASAGTATGIATGRLLSRLAGRIPYVGPVITIGGSLGAGILADKLTGAGIDALKPGARDTAAGQAGGITALALPGAAGLANLLRAGAVVKSAEGLGAAAKFVAKRAATAAGAGAGADWAVHEGMQAMGLKDGEYTPTRALTAALLSTGLGHLDFRVRGLKGPEVAEVYDKVSREVAAGAKPGTALDAETGKPVNTQADVEVYRAVNERLAAMKAKGDKFVMDPEKFRFNVWQQLQGENPVGKTRAQVVGGAVEPAGSSKPAGLETPPAAAAPAAEETPNTPAVVPGAQTTVFGAKGTEFPAVYAWAPTSAVQTSHSGAMMAPNPEYQLQNTRNYSDPAERDKQLDVLKNFDPRRHVTDAGDASVGPSLVATVIDEDGNASLQRLGGNSRGYAIANLPPEDRAQLRELENAKAGQFGLQPTADPDAELVRHLGTFDFRQPGERERAQQIVDLLNPSAGLVQGAAKRAEVDAGTVPPDRLAGLTMTMAPADAQHLVRGLMAEGRVDRNLTATVAEDPAQAQDYARRLLMNAAFRTPQLAALRMDARYQGGVVHGLMDAAVPSLVRMRALGKEGQAAADAVARTFTTALQNPGKIADALDTAARQQEFDPESVVARTVAEGLRGALVLDKGGRAMPEPTAANAGTLFNFIEKAVADYSPSPDLFGGQETVGDAVVRAVSHFLSRGRPSASEGGSKPRLPAIQAPVRAPAHIQQALREHGIAPAAAAKGAVLPEELRDAPLVYSVKGSPYANVTLRGLADMKIVEMPELVQLAKELMGNEVILQKLPRALGDFRGIGNGVVRLNPRIFRDPILAAKVLAHEIGHGVDFLPSQTLRRGNLWGRIWSLKNFLKDHFTPSGPSNKQLRAELKALSNYWKPYDPAKDPKSYVDYRESGVELYADFISVLLNSPADAKTLAPTFWKEFWKGLATKPDVKQALFELQQFLNRPFATRQAERRIKIDEMFALGEDAYIAKVEERAQRFQGFRGLLSRLKQGFFDNYSPIRDRAHEVAMEARKAGTHSPAADAIELLFDAHPLSRNEHWRWLERMQRTVVQPLEAAGLSLDDLGTYLFLNRVANENYPLSEKLAKSEGVDTGGRSVIANPLGQTPKTARDGLLAQRLQLGINKTTLLERAAEKFHDEVFEVMKDAHKAGLFTDEQMAMIASNRGNYATFTPLEYVESFVPAGIIKQTGTLKQVANPFLQTLLKVLQLHKAIEMQRMKTATLALLRSNFSGEIKPAEVRKGFGGRETPVPPRERGWEQVMVREAGVPAWYNVPAEIALMFEHTPTPLLQTAVDVLQTPFRKFFYPLYITFSPIFQLVTNPIRDVRRSMLMGTNVLKVLRQLPVVKQLGKNVPLQAVRDLVKRGGLMKNGQPNPLIAEMLDNLAITPGEATFNATAGKPEGAYDRMLQEHGLLPPDEKGKWMPTHWPVIGAILRGIQTAGRLNELLPKVAMYRELRAKGWHPKDAAMAVRNYAGTPNFGRRGRHVSVANAVLSFFNIWQKSWASDVEMARRGFRRRARPDKPGVSAASWWMRWAAYSAAPAILISAAKLGLLGKEIKDLYDGIGSYDLTNYDVVPIGHAGASDLNPNGKVAYLRIPKDPTDRVLTGLMRNLLETVTTKAAKAGAFGPAVQQMNANARPVWSDAVTKSLNIGSTDVPGLNPLLKITDAWRQYVTGHNPIDDFRDRTILTDTQFNAGGWESLKPMLAWTMKESGVGNFVHYNANDNSTTEIAVGNMPLVNGLLKITDYGFREKQNDMLQADEAAKANLKLSMPANAQKLSTEYWYLRRLGAGVRTPAQEDRYKDLNRWQTRVWAKGMEQMENTDSAEIRDGVRVNILEDSKAYERVNP